MATTFQSKYSVDATFAAEFITLGSNTTTLVDAFEVIDEDAELQQNIVDEFGYTYDEVITDLMRWFTTNTIELDSPFQETV